MSYNYLAKLQQFIVHPLIDVLFPPLCYICQNFLLGNRRIICHSCWQSIPQFDGRLDPSLKKRSLHKVFILFEFDDIIRVLIHLLKYKHHLTLADYFAREAYERFSEDLSHAYQAIVPVPLHKTRRRERGYNQSEQICNTLSKFIHIPVKNEHLVRISPTKSQTKMSRIERDKNVKDAFYSPPGIMDEKILLVDDVITTGSTVEACCHSLERAGAKEVDILAIAHPLGQI